MAMHGGEYWTTSSEVGAEDRTVQWQEMLSATHLPWTVQVAPQASVLPSRPALGAGGSVISLRSTASTPPARAPGSAGTWPTQTASSSSC